MINGANGAPCPADHAAGAAAAAAAVHYWQELHPSAPARGGDLYTSTRAAMAIGLLPRLAAPDLLRVPPEASPSTARGDIKGVTTSELGRIHNTVEIGSQSFLA